MMIPVRCFTCGSLVADKWEEFSRRVAAGEDPADIFDSLKVTRYCCRRMLLSHVDLMKEVLQFYEASAKRREANRE